MAGFDEAIVPHLHAGRALARWLMRNDDDAEDVVQEASLRALRYFGTFDGSDGRAWFLRIVRNTCYNALRARKPRERDVPIDEESDWIEDLSPLPPAILEKKGTVAAVREAIEVLPVEFREALVLRELEGLSYKEIAEVSGVPLGTVMSRLARARDQLSLILLERKQHETL